MLPCNIPQRNVDSRQRAHDGGAAKMGPAIEILPVVLDAKRILADEVTLEGVHRLTGGFKVAPGTGFTQTLDAGVGLHFDEEKTVHRADADVGDLHFIPFGAGVFSMRRKLILRPVKTTRR